MAKTVQFVDKKTNEDIYPVIDSSYIKQIDIIKNDISNISYKSPDFLRCASEGDYSYFCTSEDFGNGLSTHTKFYCGNMYAAQDGEIKTIDDIISSGEICSSSGGTDKYFTLMKINSNNGHYLDVRLDDNVYIGYGEIIEEDNSSFIPIQSAFANIWSRLKKLESK